MSILQELDREIAVAQANLNRLEQARALLAGTDTPKRRGRPPGGTRKKNGTATDAVLDAIKANPDSKPAVIAEAAGVEARVVYQTTNRLIKEGRVARGPAGGYIIPDAEPAKKPEHWYPNWRSRTFGPATDRAAELNKEYGYVADSTPYAVGRHSWCALRLRSGMWANLSQLASEMGHTTTKMITETYAHELAEYAGTAPVDWETEVRNGRKKALELIAN